MLVEWNHEFMFCEYMCINLIRSGLETLGQLIDFTSELLR